MTRRFSVAVIQGGPSPEAEVSRASARTLVAALTEAGHHAVRLELDDYLAETLRTGGYEVAFPIAHGAFGEDGALQGLLEIVGIPYVGSGVAASALAMDKKLTERHLFAELSPHVLVSEEVTTATDLRALAARCVAPFLPVVLKPAAAGSALGVVRFEHAVEATILADALAAGVHAYGRMLVQPFVRGREVTVGVLDLEEGPLALPSIEVVAESDAFYSFEARYGEGRSRHFCPAPLDDALQETLARLAKAAHVALRCRDLSRVDFLVPEGSPPVLLEVNTLPGFTRASLYPEAAKAAGFSFPALTDALVQQAVRRGPTARYAASALPTR